jgi:hypothetical protein
MNYRNDENLGALLEKFVGPEEARSCAEDIVKGEQILRRHPAPRPSPDLIAGIEAEVSAALTRRGKQYHPRRMFYRATVAAALLILALAGIRMFQGNSDIQVGPFAAIPAALWDSKNLAVDDADMAILHNQLEQIENELLVVRLGEDMAGGYSETADIEAELVDIDSDFWKG